MWRDDPGRVVLAVAVAAAAQDFPSGGGTAATAPAAQPHPRREASSHQAAQPPAAAQPAAPDPLAEGATSLFAPRWNMVQLSGRYVSSVSGDPARWQRLLGLRDGLLVTEGRALRETPDWNGTFGADNIGWRDERYFGS